MKLKKLVPGLAEAIIEAGFDQEPKEIERVAVPKIMSGGDLIVVSPEGTGKSTALVIGIIQQLKKAVEEAPRAVIMVETKEKAYEMEEQFKLLGKNTDLRTFVVFDKGILQYQKDMIYEGLDILIGTPKRIDELVSATGIPMSKMKILAVDDAELFFIPKYQPVIYRLAYLLPKSQIIVLANRWHEGIGDLEERALKNPSVVDLMDEDDQN
ncbi:DEAD/DEAH box helicase [Mangrovibacterium sp.]|uniref:DEAD/DEAH box helicase n=1 Tax=Mangrovibacterium sp. TaxID=1961364 RepID=UPI0035673EDD